MIQIKWEGDPCPDEFFQQVISEIESLNLEHPSQLYFHHVFLDENMEGRSVFVTGSNDDDFYHCEFLDKTEWVSVDSGFEDIVGIIFDKQKIMNDSQYDSCIQFFKNTVSLVDELYEKNPNDENILILERQASILSNAIVDYEASNFVGSYDPY